MVMGKLVRVIPTLLLMGLLALAVVACGSAAGASGNGQGFSNEPTAQNVSIRVDRNGKLAWERGEYEAVAGDVTFVVENPTGLAHNFAIEGNGVKAQSKQFGGETTSRFTLKGLQPGTYVIACTLPGHREAGMVATLVVR
jgi:uncharacterized cupredoxin-like copper-binding protein